MLSLIDKVKSTKSSAYAHQPQPISPSHFAPYFGELRKRMETNKNTTQMQKINLQPKREYRG